jgi:hypothetical protein
MRRLLGLAGSGLVAVVALTGCSSGSSETAATSAPVPKTWANPQDVIDGVKAAGFDCTLPSSDTTGQVLTKDPFTGKDLAGNALVRCADFQVMLAADSVDKAFALLVACQVVPESVRQSAEWTAPVVVGSNFAILPANLAQAWATGPQPTDFMKAFGGDQSTFGTLYVASCRDAVADGSAVPSASAS